MAYEQRGSKVYYYRAKKRNGRVVREYYGRGPRAQQAAAEDAAKRLAREKEQAHKAQLKTLDTQVAQLDTIITLLSHVHMIDAGFYLHHRGEWRRRKQYDHSNSTIPTTA